MLLRTVRSLLLFWTGLALTLAPARAQSGRWEAHTSMRPAQALARAPEAVWVATTGGVFSYAPATGDLSRYTVIEGLHGVSAQAIAYDAAREAVWIGYRDGVLDRLDPATGRVETFFDIARAERFGTREINRLVPYGDTLFVATAFGLVVFDPVAREVRDTYSRLGSFGGGTPVYDVLEAPAPDGDAALWVATRAGVAYAPLSIANLQDPGAWRTEADGFPDVRDADNQPLPKATRLALFEGVLYAGSADGLYARRAGGAYKRLDATERFVVDLVPTQSRLLVAEPTRLRAVAASGASDILGNPAIRQPLGLLLGEGDALWIADAQTGLIEAALGVGGGTLEVLQAGLYPEGPFDGLFSDLAVDDQGVLWAAGTQGARGRPGTHFYRLSPDGEWTSFTNLTEGALEGTANFEVVHVDPLGNVWVGSYGRGLAQVTPEGEVVRYTEQNSSLQGADTPTFVIPGGLGSSSDGTLWVTNLVARNPLSLRAPDGTWTALPALRGGGLTASMNAYRTLLVDTFGQKWIALLDERDFRNGRGLIVLDTGADPADPTDDLHRFFGATGRDGQGLPGLRVQALAEDRDGRIWVGTREGLAYFINTGIVAQDPSATAIWPQWADRSLGVFALRGLGINDLAVDPANRLWVAADDGVRLLEEEPTGWRQVAHFTETNSPLFSDVVRAVAVDGITGRVYFATDQGLVSYQGDAVAPRRSAAGLDVYPNPVRLEEGEAPLIYIDGLVESTELRILAPHGSLVARLTTRGGRATWDGRDLQQKLVPSGMYLVVAVGENGEGAAYGKVAVIR